MESITPVTPDITRAPAWPRYRVEQRPGTGSNPCAPHEVIDTHQPGRVVVFASEHTTCWWDRNNDEIAGYVCTFLNWKDRDFREVAPIAAACERLIAEWQKRQVAA